MAPHPVAAWTPVAAGLTAAGCVAWLVCPGPRYHVLSWNDVFVWAAMSVSAVFLTSVAVVWVLYVFLPPRVAVDIRYTTFRASATTVWLPPLVLFLSDGSLWALVAGVI